MSKPTKRPKGLFKSRTHKPDSGELFRLAMEEQDVKATLVAANRAKVDGFLASSCVGCGGPSSLVGILADPAKLRVGLFRLCQGCAKRGVEDRQFRERVERDIRESIG